jgi:hypothetical protein
MPSAKLLNSPNGTSCLSSEQKLAFERDGWTGVFSLLSPSEADALCHIFARVQSRFTQGPDTRNLPKIPVRKRRPWAKSLHAYLPEFYDIASHPAIVGRVSSLLGENVIAWGCQVVTRDLGHIHRWHVDVEHTGWPGVSVFLGLKAYLGNRASAS